MALELHPARPASTKRAHGALALVLPVMVACAGVCALGPKTGEEALKACQVTPIEEMFPGATLVAAICDNPGGLATPTGNDLYLHLRAPSSARLAESRPQPTPARPKAAGQNSMDCPLLVASDGAQRTLMRDLLTSLDMAVPPNDASYTVWRTEKPVMVDDGRPATLVEQLRSGEDVWLRVRACEPG